MPPKNLEQLLNSNTAPAPLLNQIRTSPSAHLILSILRAAVPDLSSAIPQTTYTLYRQFAQTGERAAYEDRYFAKRSLLTRAVVELILGDDGVFDLSHDLPRKTSAVFRRTLEQSKVGKTAPVSNQLLDLIHDLLWSLCEETSWVLPAHEDRSHTGSSSALIREPDYIDLFAAETAADLAETIYLLGERLAPEVVQRVRQEVERRIFFPYLAYGRKFWWHTGDLNWNAVCNGAVGLAFMRLEKDSHRLAEALGMVLEGFEAYLATGFEPDGGSLEGIGYWNYGLLYYVALAELLREQTANQIDLLANPRLLDIARFPSSMAVAPGQYLNFGDAAERISLQPGIVQRLAERTSLVDLSRLILPPAEGERERNSTASLAIVLRDIAWWDGQPRPFPAAARKDAYLPDCAIVKFNAQTVQGQPVILAVKAGRNDGHHYHLDIGHFIVNVGGESLLCDPGRGLYTREYFSPQRFQNIFCNSFGHSVPRIGGRLQMAGPKFGGGRLAEGKIVDYGQKFVVIDFAALYDLPELTAARRMLRLNAETGEIRLEDIFEFSGEPLEIEEAFVTWHPVSGAGATAQISGKRSELSLHIQEPAGASFHVSSLREECQANQREGVLTRLTVQLPAGALRFALTTRPPDYLTT